MSASEIVLRFYLTIGFAALIGLATLAATSTDAMIRRLGAPNWNRLHKLVYLIAPLALLHFFLQAKANVAEPAMMTGLYLPADAGALLARASAGRNGRARWLRR